MNSGAMCTRTRIGIGSRYGMRIEASDEMLDETEKPGGSEIAEARGSLTG